MHSEIKQDSRGTIAGDAVPHAWPEGPPASVAEPRLAPRRMSRRRMPWRWIVSALLAAGAHGMVALPGLFDLKKDEVPPPPAVEEYVMLEMPELEPPEVIEVVEVTDAVAPPEMAPPSQMDLPSTVAVSAFLQPMQPHLDPSLTSVGAIKIPPMTGNFGQPGAGAIKLFDLKELDRVPRRTRTVVPVYPFELRRAGVMGEVVLLVIIDPSGHVEVERVISATHREFEVAAVKAAEQCVYESPLKGGQKVSARYTWSIPFMLQ